MKYLAPCAVVSISVNTPYATERNLRWSSPALQAKYGYQVRYPQSGRSGVSLTLSPRQSEG